jgi:mannosyltransferase OCH1-like enzyme
MAVETVLEKNPEYAYHYYNGTERREFIKNHMAPAVLAAYDKVNPNAYKADIFRYSVVYIYGGCYFDIAIIAVGHLRDTIHPNDSFVSANDLRALNSAFFCAEPHHPILDIAIKEVVKRVSKSSYGKNAIDITGPFVFGRAFKEYNKDPGLKISPREYPGGVRLLHHLETSV